MRADAEGYVARIDAALNLVKMSLDWERALRRLDELNAKVEDPSLWDNPKAAEEVMRERRRLDAAIATVREIDADKAGTVELIELAEMEGDAALGDEGAAALKALADRADRDKVSALLSGEADGNDTFIEFMLALAVPRAKIGRKCYSACIIAGPNNAATKLRWSIIRQVIRRA